MVDDEASAKARLERGDPVGRGLGKVSEEAPSVLRRDLGELQIRPSDDGQFAGDLRLAPESFGVVGADVPPARLIFEASGIPEQQFAAARDDAKDTPASGVVQLAVLAPDFRQRELLVEQRAVVHAFGEIANERAGVSSDWNHWRFLCPALFSQSGGRSQARPALRRWRA